MAKEHAVSDTRGDGHLRPDEVAAYADGTVDADVRAAIQAHLATCAECRAEVADVFGVLGTLPHSRHVGRRVWIPAAAAAAVAAILLARPLPHESVGRRPGAGSHREAAMTATIAPRPLAPVGVVDSAGALVWSPVPSADRYHARLFDADGTVLWEGEVEDTVAALPAAVAIAPGRSYYWKVEAHTGVERWAASDLVDFTRRARAP
jgi:anti-sigma factor RsiW